MNTTHQPSETTMKNDTRKPIRQGDVLLVPIATVPASAQKHKVNILAYGETSGHVHEVFGDVEVLADGEQLYVSVTGKLTTLEHVHQGTRTQADHNTIDLPSGAYRVVIQREYDPYEDAVRQVQD